VVELHTIEDRGILAADFEGIRNLWWPVKLEGVASRFARQLVAMADGPVFCADGNEGR